MGITVDNKLICQIDGRRYPAIGFGTYPLQEDVGFNAVLQAGKMGYRIIDTATFYKNFQPVGKALNELGRENFYIISKVWPIAQTSQGIFEDFKTTLTQLNTSYLDAYLLHWPNYKIPIQESLTALDNLRKSGLVRHIGLSNVTVNHLKRALLLEIPIDWVQIEMHPLFYDPDLLEFCQENLIALQAWTPLARGRVFADSFLIGLGKKYGKTAGQIALKWIAQHRCVPLPGSKDEHHMHQNMDIQDFSLSQEEMLEINTKAKSGERLRIDQAKGLGFADEFDFSYEQCWPSN